MQATSQPAGLPAPTGRYQVGRVSFELVDPARVEIYSSNPQDRRELVVWLWYPAAPGPGAERAVYLPEAWAPTGQLLGLDAAGLRSHAVEGAAVADQLEQLPADASGLLAGRLDLGRLGGFGHSFGGKRCPAVVPG